MEMSEGIYENDEMNIIEKTVETHTTKHEQQPSNSEFIAAGSCWHKLALVCQGLLCVFLLIVIIVLGVYINLTAARNHLKKDYYNLTVVRDQLQMNYFNLTVERNQLRNENIEILKKFNQLKQECTYFNSSVYSIITRRNNWTESRKDCIQRGADLVIINSKEEQNFISRCFPNTQAWIGLNDIDTEGKWMWVDGTALNTRFWWDREPNNNGGNEDCVGTGYEKAKYTLKSWNDFSCNYFLVGICERKFLAP